VAITDIDPISPAAEHVEQANVLVSVNRHPVNCVGEFKNYAAEVRG
jgi:hypothetical protein